MGDVDRSAEIEKDAMAQKTKWEATSRWARAAQWALAMSLTNSQNDLTAICEEDGEETILEFTRDATRTLHQVYLLSNLILNYRITFSQYAGPMDDVVLCHVLDVLPCVELRS